MAIPVEMPKLSDTMEEGVVSAWQAEEGDAVSAGDVIAQVETDKATMDLEVFDDGVLLKKVAQEGDTVPLGALIAILGDEGEDISDILSAHGAGGDGAAETAEAEAPDEEPVEEEEAAEEAPEAEERVEEVEAEGEDVATHPKGTSSGAEEAAPSGDGRVKASPLARRMARENEVDLATMDGSGPQGRIIKRDVEAVLEGRTAAPDRKEALPAGAAAAAEAEAAYATESISQMRKAIARRLAESKFSAPHFYLTVDVDVEKAVRFREELNALAEKQERPHISFNDLITKACALALKTHPQVNASYLADEGELRYYEGVHIGIAVAIDEGLITPVIRHADRKGLGQIAEETRALAERARNRKLQPEEYEGATFTTSNLGMFGIEEFTAIINPPNACILAIGTIRDVPVVKEGAVVPGKRMRVTLSCDHRIVDGATGAEFLATARQYLEEPMSLML